MPTLHQLFATVCVSILFVGCQPNAERSTSEQAGVATEEVDVPVGEESGQPQLHTDGSNLWLSWIEPAGQDEHRLRYASFDGETWSDPGTVASGPEWFVNWADVPSVRSLPDGRKAAHFLVSNGPNIFAYDVRIAQTNAQEEWQEAITPHDDGTQTEHGFVSMLPWQDDLMAVWLDGREMVLDPDDEHDHGTGAMTLRAGLLDSEGDVLESFLLDDHVCECCPTAGVETGGGLLFAYRDRTEDNIRNISLVRFDEEGWTEPYTLHDDGWHLDGCPVNGPALAANGDRVVASWFTAAHGEPRVYAAFSEDAGRTFGDPIIIDEHQPNGQVGTAFLEDGSAVISWHGRHEDEDALLVKRLVDSEATSDPVVVHAPMPAVRTGIPRIARLGDHLYAAWVERGDEDNRSKVRMARVPRQALK